MDSVRLRQPAIRRSRAGALALALVLVLLGTVSLNAQFKVLFIGNSFTFGDRVDANGADDVSVPAIFEALALAAGQPAPLVGMSAVGGGDFQYHAGMDGNGFQGTLDAIDSQAWTHIVLQNYSTEPTHATALQGSVADHLTYGGALYLVAMDLNPKPTVLLYETWARAAANTMYSGASTASTFVNPDEFQNEVWFNYRRLSDLLNTDPNNAGNPQVKISPVGDTWQVAGGLLPAGNPDSIDLFATDDYHGNDSGYYLSAAVFFSRIYGASPVGLHASPYVANLNLDVPSAAFLEQVAWAVVSDDIEPLATYLLDFGAIGTTTSHGVAPNDPVYFWNNVTETIGTSPSGQLANLVTVANASSTVDLVIVDAFAGANSNGTTSSSLFPTAATRDSLFGNTESFNGLANIFPSFKLAGLDAELIYQFTFYASRTGVADNRETLYTAVGATSGSTVLNAANNGNLTATVAGIKPTAGGEITVSLDPGANNNSANHFTYLSVMKVDALLFAPTVTSAATASGTFGTPFNYTITANAAPTSYGTSGLPPGLSVNPATGVISGTPTASGIYASVISANNSSGTGQAALTITVAKAAASVTLSNLSPTYSGSPHSATVVTMPASLPVSVTYNGSGIAPTGAGTYAVVATIVDGNYQGSASGTLTVGKATATVTLGSLIQTYTGTARPITTSSSPGGLSVSVTYAGGATAPTAAGTYAVVGTIVDANYQGSASGTLTVGKATATVTLGSLSQTYTGTARSITTTTSPGGLNVNVTYAGSVTAPTGVGTYAVVATIIDVNYQGSASGTLTVGKATATVTLGNVSQTYTGTARSITTTTSPGGLNVNVTYAGSAAAPTPAGTYAVVGTIVDANYQGSASGTLTVGKATAVVMLADLAASFDGAPHTPTVTTSPAGRPVSFTFDGGSAIPTLPGSYAVVATIVDVNFQGSASDTLTIGPGFVLDQAGSLPVTAGSVTTLSVTALDMPGATFQWQLQEASSAWINLAGANDDRYSIPSTQRFHAGAYRVQVSFNGQSTSSAPVVLSVEAPAPSNARLLNLSTRGLSQGGGSALIPGFVIGGTGNKRLLIRAVGPTLAVAPINFGGTVLPDPRMELKRFDASTNQFVDVAANDDWGTNANAAAIAATAAQLFAFELKQARDAALLVDLPPGKYSVVARDASDAAGVAIVEIYDADPANTTSRLINVSNRGFSGTGASVIIPGFVVSSEGPKTLLLRVVGPTLAGNPFNVPGTMLDPKLVLYRTDSQTGQTTEILTQDNWSNSPDAAHTAEVAQDVFAFPLNPGSADAAIVVTLEPGVYSIHGASADGMGTGVVLVEAYVVP